MSLQASSQELSDNQSTGDHPSQGDEHIENNGKTMLYGDTAQSNTSTTDIAANNENTGSNHATPSPIVVAQKSVTSGVAKVSTYTEADIEKALSFGRVSDDGRMYVTIDGSGKEIGSVATKEEAEANLRTYAQRYLDLRSRMQLFQERMRTNTIRTSEIDQSIKALDEEINTDTLVGDIPALQKLFLTVTQQAQELKEKRAELRQKAIEAAIASREALVEQVEQLIQSLGDSTNWRQAAQQLDNFLEQWKEQQKTQPRLSKTVSEALWKRFSAARSTFNRQRHAWIKQRESMRQKTRDIKESIVKQAQEMKDSTNWVATSRAYNSLMDQWKSAGRIGGPEDNQLWKQFREAADVFFNARQANRDVTNAAEQENLTKKEALLTKAQELVPIKSKEEAKNARKALIEIEDQWQQIGNVPRSEHRRIEGEFSSISEQIENFEKVEWAQKDPEKAVRKDSFAAQLTSQIDELKEKIAQESDAHKQSELKSELATKEQWLQAINSSNI